MKQDIIKKWFFQKRLNEVWDYLTIPELLAEWLMNNDFKPVVGHKFQFRGNSEGGCETEGVAHCEVLEIIPLKFLSYTWKYGPGDGSITLDSLVSWTLSEKDGGTELLLQHKGFSLEEDYYSHAKGWDRIEGRITQILNEKNHARSNT
ncbi:MAG: SRPBCC domain-containing protein [Chitinophagales bacterium]